MSFDVLIFTQYLFEHMVMLSTPFSFICVLQTLIGYSSDNVIMWLCLTASAHLVCTCKTASNLRHWLFELMLAVSFYILTKFLNDPTLNIKLLCI